MKHTFEFKNSDDFGHYIYSAADVEKGYDGVKREGHYIEIGVRRND